MPKTLRLPAWYNLPGIVAAYQPVGAPDAFRARWNIGNDKGSPLVYAGVPGADPAFAPWTGWGFAGSHYLETLISPPQSAQIGSMLIRYSGWTRDSWTMLAGTFFGEGGTREFNVGKQSNYCISNHGILSVTLPVSGVVGFAGNVGYIDGVNVGTLTSPGVYSTRRVVIGAGVYYNDGLVYYKVTANIQALIILNRTLTPGEAVLVSHQMAYCEANPAWNVWARQRRYFYKPPAAVTGAGRALVNASLVDHGLVNGGLM